MLQPLTTGPFVRALGASPRRTEPKRRRIVQQTLKTAVTFLGAGLHSGDLASLVVHPAPADHGLWFRRTDIRDADPMVPAHWNAVQPSRLCTVVANAAGTSVSTVEHLMAALAGCGIHNALIDIDAAEVPILDGSAAPFVAAFLAAGFEEQDAPVRAIRILKAVEVRDGAAVARLEPAEMMEIDFSIEFADAAIGAQTRTLNMANGAFVRELSDSRTFCRAADVAEMQARGLALGGTVDNAVVFEGAAVLSPGGLRHADEPVRHKMLDAMGDLFLAGGPILGRYVGHRAGHALTNRLLRALFADPTAYAIDVCGTQTGMKLPGAGVHPGDLPVAR
jgi:UDP-3-O-[3-hydroxymyristoyl] N-acetylglucosamine deacetylase